MTFHEKLSSPSLAFPILRKPLLSWDRQYNNSSVGIRQQGQANEPSESCRVSTRNTNKNNLIPKFFTKRRGSKEHCDLIISLGLPCSCKGFCKYNVVQDCPDTGRHFLEKGVFLFFTYPHIVQYIQYSNNYFK
jgi:hypothetical protein